MDVGNVVGVAVDESSGVIAVRSVELGLGLTTVTVAMRVAVTIAAVCVGGSTVGVDVGDAQAERNRTKKITRRKYFSISFPCSKFVCEYITEPRRVQVFDTHKNSR